MQKTNLRDVFRNPRIQTLVGVSVIVPLLIFYILFVGKNLTTTFDDAYMFDRYANNALAGHGIAWNPDGVQTYGATSLFYLLIIILVKALLPLADGSVVLTVTSSSLGILSLAILAIGCARLAGSAVFKRSPLIFAALLAVVFLPSPVFLFHTSSGMDTSLSLLCNSLLIFAVLNWVNKGGKTALLLLIAVAYLSFLARPDNLIYAALFPLLYGFFFLKEDRIKKIGWFLTGLGVVVLIDTVIKYAIFGDPLPLPFYAKTSGYDDGYLGAFRWNPVGYIFDFCKLILPFIYITAFSVSGKTRQLIAAFFIPVLTTFAYYFSVVQIMGFQARYYFPTVPFFVIGGFIALDQETQDSQEIKDRINILKQPLRFAFAIAFAIILWTPSIERSLADKYESFFVPEARAYEVTTKYSTPLKIPELGWWKSINAISEICKKMPNGTRVAMTEYGLVGSKAAQVYIIDLLGLHDPFFAHNGFEVIEFFNRRPDFIWFPHPDYTKIIASIENSPKFWEEYDFYPQAFDYGIAIRKNGENNQVIYEITKSVWNANYAGLDLDRYIARQP